MRLGYCSYFGNPVLLYKILLAKFPIYTPEPVDVRFCERV